MSSNVFFSFKEEHRGVVLTIKGSAVNPNYKNLNFKVNDLTKRWKTQDQEVIKQAIFKWISGTSRTIVFVGEKTHISYWVPHEVQMTLDAKKPVYAIRLKDTSGEIPKCLSDNKIKVYSWSEERLQELATRGVEARGVSYMERRVCNRCKQQPNMVTVSYMNTDIICRDCKTAEQNHPMFQVAREAKQAACVSGDYNYSGLFADKTYPF